MQIVQSVDPHAQLRDRWDQVLAALRRSIGDELYNAQFTRLQLDRFEEDCAHVSVPTRFSQHQLQTRYREQFLASLQYLKATENPVAYTVVVRGASSAKLAVIRRGSAEAATGVDTLPAPQPPRSGTETLEGSPVDHRHTFRTFAFGACNQLAYAIARQVADDVRSPVRPCNPLFIHAGVGLGKSHLLHAIATEVRQDAEANVLYTTADRFQYMFVEAIKHSTMRALREDLLALDMLLVDDLQFMHGHKTEQEFEHMIGALLDNNVQVVVACSRPPQELERYSERLRTRLQRGLVVEIGAPDAIMRRAILARFVREKKESCPSFAVSDEVMTLFAHGLTHARELEAATTHAYLRWTLSNTPVTSAIAEGIIRAAACGDGPRRIRIEDVLQAVAKHFAVSRVDILSQRRHRSVVLPRQVGMFLAKRLTSRSLPEIGRRFGDRDHTTVLHAIRKIDSVMQDNPTFKAEIEEIEKKLLEA